MALEAGVPAHDFARVCELAACGGSRSARCEPLLKALGCLHPAWLEAALSTYGYDDLAAAAGGEQSPPAHLGIYTAAAGSLAHLLFRAPDSWRPLLGPDSGSLLGGGACDLPDAALARRQYVRAAAHSMQQVGW